MIDAADDYVNDQTSGWRSPLLMLSDTDCASCGEPVGIFVRIDGAVTCSTCWKKRGKPFPRAGASVKELHEAELATRERMQRRGGADRHMVRSGKS